jgi:circadian clock protein KaiB
MPFDASTQFRGAAGEGELSPWILRLYVAGMSARSTGAIRSVKKMCEGHLAGRYDLQVFDIYSAPAQASADHASIAPMLVKAGPFPPARVIGDLEDQESLLLRLGLTNP